MPLLMLLIVAGETPEQVLGLLRAAAQQPRCYDVRYSIARTDYVVDEPTKSNPTSADFKRRRLTASEVRPPRVVRLRCVFSEASKRRIEVLREDGSVEAVVVYADSAEKSYWPQQNDFVIRQRETKLVPEHHDYEEYMRNWRGIEPLLSLLEARHEKGLLECSAERDMLVVRARPGDRSAWLLSNMGYVFKFARARGLMLDGWSRGFEKDGALRPNLRFAVSRSKQVASGVFVPAIARFEYVDESTGETDIKLELTLDEGNSSFNEPIDPSLFEIAPPAGAVVTDTRTKTRYVAEPTKSGPAPKSIEQSTQIRYAATADGGSSVWGSTQLLVAAIGGCIAMFAIAVFLVRKRLRDAGG